MASIKRRLTKNGSISYQVKIRLKGIKTISKTFRTEAEAKTWVNQTETSLRQLKHIPNFTLSDFIDRFITDIFPTRTKKYQTSYLSLFNFWRERLGDKIANQITNEEIETHADSLYRITNRNGNVYSPESRRKYIQVLGCLYNTAIRHWKWAVYNPASQVDLHTDSIKQSRKKEVSSKKNNSWKDFKRKFVEAMQQQLKKIGLPTNPGKDVMAFFSMQKSTAQHLLNPESNSTLETIFFAANKLNIEIDLKINDRSIEYD